MKQVLIYLVEFLKEQHGMSMSEMSKGLGRSRNFIREAITRGYEDEERYKNIIVNLDYQFFVSGDYVDFMKFMENKHQQELYKTEIAGDKIVDLLHERIELVTNKNKELEQQVVILERSIDRGWKRTDNQNEEIVKLNNSITTKDKFIDGQDEEIKVLNERLSVLTGKVEFEKELVSNLKLELEGVRGLIKTGNNKLGRKDFYIKTLEEMHEDLKSDNKVLYTENTNLQKRNRILVSMLIFFCVIDLIMAFLRHM